jgi:hypothetical protein
MKTRNLFRILGAAVVLWGIGVVAVNNQGYASCVPETGLTGLLHKALFAPSATCKINPDNTCQAAGTVCSTRSALSAGSSTQGHCGLVNNACACIPDSPPAP